MGGSKATWCGITEEVTLVTVGFVVSRMARIIDSMRKIEAEQMQSTRRPMWSACRSLMTTVVVVVVVVVVVAIEDGMEKSDNLRLPSILVRRVDINARVTATKNTEENTVGP